MSMDNKKRMKVNVLGAEYTIEFSNEIDDTKLIGTDGYCDFSTHKIVISDLDSQKTAFDMEDLDSYERKVIRHEMIHAFLEESGLSCYSHDETIVDWFAIQAEKIFTQFVAAGVMKVDFGNVITDGSINLSPKEGDCIDI